MKLQFIKDALFTKKDFLLKKQLQLEERAIKKDFSCVQNRTNKIRARSIIVCSVLKDEKKRLSFFLRYYRAKGVDHFLFIDNESSDNTIDYLSQQEDCSVWTVKGWYNRAREGQAWSNFILHKYARQHWILRIDPDEFLVYPYSNYRNLHELTRYLDKIGSMAFYTPLIDCYSRHAGDGFSEDDDMQKKYPYFDRYGYSFSHQRVAVGGVRQRVFYSNNRTSPPILNKFALIKWNEETRFVASTHKFVPDELCRVQLNPQTISPTGCLLHYKITDDIKERATVEIKRKSIFDGASELEVFLKSDIDSYYVSGLSQEYHSWKSLEEFGLLTAGSWR